ncbi:penicillin-binding protein 1C [Commensalibacter papalotli (ex Botero et al. 2024)]|uniref:peptidoglycan glycosyltransferase n=1 Tax=Commensalibacter papalotli (ex Botero et al. 2024) TaxID=2972766 RepID=A0ABN8WC15_9PROT|nr:penicillin-binding protein 1C [Commensalibacter papalotli (ex Botero et al. 2024)]CAI3941888.1 Membrane carboxypeptidase/penicillin-binding protein PbpC (PbpC) [Commensalibacter papalotli (ex Botero et al. 2024)]CAI3949090.1 Membrane carboxypeptidase/penicillin-binding protein PbpC (PbpC) [Commensalibacter papalotli (ex Botero et al. 2024)]
MIHFLKKWQNWICAGSLIIIIIIGCRLYPHPALKDSLPISRTVYDQSGKLLRLTLAKDDRYRLWVPLNKISPTLINAVLLHEDQWFYYHLGTNPYGIARGALVTYILHGHRQGGSTITMQLARLLYQLNTKKPWGKVKQIYYATKLELLYSKKEILEAYLNIAPYGGNVEGIQTASLIYFNKNASELNIPETLLLAVIPQEPNLRLRCKNKDTCLITNKNILKARSLLYNQWIKTYPTDNNVAAFIKLPLPLRPVSKLPFEAPHFSEQVLNQYPTKSNLMTTLDLSLQHILEQQITNYVSSNGQLGIHNAAALLVDTNDMSIKAMIGSANYFNQTISGQINGTSIKRSPGSSLKPFIYGLGFDQGILHPQSILYDIPMTFSGYAPENFDRHFEGPLTATKALNLSRNIPAVWVESKLSNPNFYQFLANATIHHLKSQQYYGLSLALGGEEISMQQEANLYALLANQGKLQPLRFLLTDPIKDGKSLLSNEARFMVIDILSQNKRPDETTSAIHSPFPIAWKTGTSSGFRDAWTAGLFSHYVLIVWVGNFDNSSNSNSTGVKTAAPLFFNIIDALQPKVTSKDLTAWQAPQTLKKVQVCLASGDLPNHWCPQTGYTWFIPGVSPIKVSTLHQPVIIDKNTGKVACPPFEGKQIHTEIFEFWPSEIQSIFKRAGLSYRSPPSDKSCKKTFKNTHPPHIRSPHAYQTYLLRSKLKDHDQTFIALTANADGNISRLYWFANNNFLGETPPNSALFWQPELIGNYHISVTDDQGQSDSVNITIDSIQ